VPPRADSARSLTRCSTDATPSKWSKVSDDYSAITRVLGRHADRPDSQEYRAAVQRLRELAEGGDLEAAEALAEILGIYGPLHDAAEAYKWYYIALSQQGYLVEFKDTGAGGNQYCGPDGDFRNESMVSGLLAELGHDRARSIDRTAAAWLNAHGLVTG
jgi:hypothetical protein